MSGYPFSAVLGADDMRLALVLNAVSPQIGGVLVRGEKGTAKSTAVRALAALLPPIRAVVGCRFGCDPAAPEPGCPDGPHPVGAAAAAYRPRLVELPVGASEDRLIGSLDLQRALSDGVRAFEPGLLADAHRGVLYVDEVNLLADHLVDVLLDAAAMGRNHVERDAVSVTHAARFVLIGSMNPEEGELRPQLLDRFGLAVDVAASRDPQVRAEVVRRRLAADADPDGFAARWADDEAALAGQIAAARHRLTSVVLPDAALRQIAEVCAAFDVDGMRADIVTARTAIAHAAWSERDEVDADDVRAAALLALPHRRRRAPFDEQGMDTELLDEALERSAAQQSSGPSEPSGASEPSGPGQPEDDGPEDDGPEDDGPGGGAAPSDGPHQAGASGSSGAPPQQSPLSPAAAPARALTGSTARRLASAPAGRRAPARTGRGRIVGILPRGATDGPVHLPATLFAAALRQADAGSVPRSAGVGRLASVDGFSASGGFKASGSRGARTRPVRFAVEDLRRADRRGREANLVLFVVDASGSMGARSRMAQVKGAVLGLLVDAYQRRDKVALITFRATGAEVVLPPTTSVEFALRRLEGIATGGRTPLAAGLTKALQVVRIEQLRDPSRRPLILLLTDGRADNRAAVRAAPALRGHDLVVVDCEQGPVRLGLARGLAADLGAQCVPLGDCAPSGLSAA